VVDYLCKYYFFQKKLKRLLFNNQENIESDNNDQVRSCLGLLKNKPQINADERRLIKSEEEICIFNRNSNLNHKIINITTNESKMNELPDKIIKQSKRKLFRQISAFIRVHLRLIFVSLSDIIHEIHFELFQIINENSFVPVPRGI
jgi:hypothetical protein